MTANNEGPSLHGAHPKAEQDLWIVEHRWPNRWEPGSGRWRVLESMRAERFFAYRLALASDIGMESALAGGRQP